MTRWSTAPIEKRQTMLMLLLLLQEEAPQHSWHMPDAWLPITAFQSAYPSTFLRFLKMARWFQGHPMTHTSYPGSASVRKSLTPELTNVHVIANSFNSYRSMERKPHYLEIMRRLSGWLDIALPVMTRQISIRCFGFAIVDILVLGRCWPCAKRKYKYCRLASVEVFRKASTHFNPNPKEQQLFQNFSLKPFPSI